MKLLSFEKQGVCFEKQRERIFEKAEYSGKNSIARNKRSLQGFPQ